MHHLKRDRVYLMILLACLIAIPLGMRAYDAYYWHNRIPGEAKVFTLTGHSDYGWILGDRPAYAVASPQHRKMALSKPVIEVKQGDLVVLKLKSSDVIHGFSYKAAGIFINDGIEPGKVTLVSFRAEKPGTYRFSCNAICGDNHNNMQGTIVVTA